MKFSFLILTKQTGGLNLNPIDNVGSIFLEVIRKGGYWVLLCIAIADVYRTATRGEGTQQIIKTIAKYFLIYSSTYIIPLGFKLIEEAFA